MKDLFETCKHAELCKIECPSCDNDMCNGLFKEFNLKGLPCCRYEEKE